MIVKKLLTSNGNDCKDKYSPELSMQTHIGTIAEKNPDRKVL